MKLDSIVYDTSALASALSEQLQMESPTFKAMYPSETATSLVNVLAGYGSMLQYMVVSSIANCYTDSAFSPSGIYQLAETLGNRLHGNIASTVVCELERPKTGNLSPIIIPANSIFTVEGKPFFNPYAISFGHQIDNVKDVLLVQGTQTFYEKLTSGVEDEKIYFGSDFKVDPNYLHVYVNDVEWEIVDSFIAYDKYSVLNPQEMQSVVVRTDSDGRNYVKFGNGINGLVPDVGSRVTISYVINDGENGNILKNDLTVNLITPIYYSDNQTQLVITAAHTSTAYGGANTQDLMTLKESSPYVFASGERCIRRNDYTAMLLNKCGYKTCNVWGEYEQAQLKGAYDKSMMNMVYYTGLKSFRYFAPYNIGSLNYSTMTSQTNNVLSADSGIYHWTGSLDTSRALPGSVQITIDNIQEPDTKIVFTDSGGHGILFNNDDLQFDSDDLLEDFTDGIASLHVINGGETGYNTIENIVYNLPNSNLNSYYESEATPLRKSPVQIALDYSDPNKKRSIAGVKFYIPNGDARYLQNSIGSFAIYGSNTPKPSYDNVSNNSEWSEVIPFTTLSSGDVGNWTNWVASSLYETGAGANITLKSDDVILNGVTYYRDISMDSIQYSSYAWTTEDGKDTVYTSELVPTPYNSATYKEGSVVYSSADLHKDKAVATVQFYTNWPTFTHYVIEIYSLHNDAPETLKMGKMKVLYAEIEKNGERVTEVSTIDYDKNGAINLNVSSASKIFDEFYVYDIAVSNIKKGTYKEGDVLTYSYDTLFYAYHAVNINSAGSNYIVGDIVSITNGTKLLNYKITRVGSNGEVIDGELLTYSGDSFFEDKTGAGEGYTTTLVSRPASILTIRTSPQNVEVALDGRCYVTVYNGYTNIKYFRNVSLDKDYSNIHYLAWTTLDAETIYTQYNESEDYKNVAYYVDHGGQLMEEGNTSDYQPPLPEPEGFRLGLMSKPILFEYTVKVNGTLPIPDRKLNNDFAVDVDVKIDGIDTKHDTTVYFSRFDIEVDPEKPAPEGRLVSEDGSMKGGLLTIKSTEALEIKASYYGNKLSATEIAKIDSVIIDQYNHFTTYLEYVEPKIVSTYIKARVHYKDSINITAVKQQIRTAIDELFALHPFSMGKVLYLSEVYNAIRDVEGVDYVLIDYPTTNVVIDKNQLLVLSELTLIDVI